MLLGFGITMLPIMTLFSTILSVLFSMINKSIPSPSHCKIQIFDYHNNTLFYI